MFYVFWIVFKMLGNFSRFWAFFSFFVINVGILRAILGISSLFGAIFLVF